MVHKCFFNEIIAGPSILEIDCRAKRDVNVYITRVATARCGEKPNTIFYSNYHSHIKSFRKKGFGGEEVKLSKGVDIHRIQSVGAFPQVCLNASR